jgi:hypothetical protein
MMRFGPCLHIDAETTGLIESACMPFLESPTVIVTDAYPFPLAAEIVRDAVRVRAATGDELAAFLTVADRRSSSVMSVASDNSLDVAEAKGFLDGTNDVRVLLTSIGTENEAVVRSLIDNPATGPFVVLG